MMFSSFARTASARFRSLRSGDGCRRHEIATCNKRHNDSSILPISGDGGDNITVQNDTRSKRRTRRHVPAAGLTSYANRATANFFCPEAVWNEDSRPPRRGNSIIIVSIASSPEAVWPPFSAPPTFRTIALSPLRFPPGNGKRVPCSLIASIANQDIGKALDHPGVMKVYEDKDRSQLYMVMEWVDGRLLRSILNAEKKLPPERAVKIALGIADALAYIHSRGVVHRDLKPENIMVGPEDRIKLIDFGIAGQEASAPPHLRKLSLQSDGHS